MSKKFKLLNMGHLPFATEANNILAEVFEVTNAEPGQERLLQLIPEMDAYFCSLKVQVNREVLNAATMLKVIATPSTGLDHIDVAYAGTRGIAILGIKDDYDVLKNITSTAEQAWALLLGVLRKIPWGFEAAKNGIWGRDRFRGHQLNGKTFGILGYGRLGEMVAEYARAFRMRVIACDLKKIAAQGIEQVDFATLLRESDVLSIHIHLTEENRGLINRAAFSKMKDGIVLINTSRGAIIDETAFVEALKSGKVSAAGVDVISGEWSLHLKDHPLVRYAREHENLLISPHVGGVTYEAQIMAYTHTARKLAEYFRKTV